MRTLGTLLVGFISAVYLVLSLAEPANAAVSCSFANDQVTVTATGDGTSTTIARSGEAVQVDYANCGTATVTTTSRIVVNGAAGRQTVVLDFSGGSFEPGLGSDTGVAEIEIDVKLAGGNDLLVLNGGTAAETFRIGASGINDNGDADLDVTIPNVESLVAYGNNGDDTIEATGGLGTGAAYSANLQADGGYGNDTIAGGAGSSFIYPGGDLLSGNYGDDVISAGAGADGINGGPGNDRLSGDDGNDRIYPDYGDDIVFGGNDEDILMPNCDPGLPDGTDAFNGGDGYDAIDYFSCVLPLTVSIDGIANDGQPGELDNVQPDVESVNGGNDADTIVGSSSNNSLSGNGGPDVIRAGGGADNVYGGDGSDLLYGEAGGDWLVGQAGDDQIDGGTGNDAFSTWGQEGNDSFVGGAGDDSFVADAAGLDGSDVVSGGMGYDVADYSARTGNLTITLGDGAANDGLVGELDRLAGDIEEFRSGAGNDMITGTAQSNLISGGSGDDSINGRGGNDYLLGGTGNDRLIGYDGEDQLYGDIGADSFYAKDGGLDFVYGGSDADTDVVVSKDPFDSLFDIP